MSRFGKFRCAFGYVPSAALTTEFAMQTRQPQSSFSLETARRRNLVCAQTLLISKLFILLEPERVGKFRVLKKLEIEVEQLECPCTAENKCEFAQSQTRLLEYTCSMHQYDNFQNGRFVQLSNFKESISFASDFNSSSVRVRPFPIF